jgi:pimeloyl-ACP methyl ester carboxylesterase
MGKAGLGEEYAMQETRVELPVPHDRSRPPAREHGRLRHFPCVITQPLQVLLFCFFILLCQPATAAVFRGTFEEEGHTPLRGAIVELRGVGEAIKATTTSDEWRTFRPFAATSMQSGDAIVAYGGTWNDQPFVGEFRLLIDSGASLQNVDPISTMVTAVAASELVSGTSANERIDSAVGFLTDFGLIDSDWRNGSPARVNQPLQGAINDLNGVQNWIAALLVDLEDNDLKPAWMTSFPHIHGGIVGTVEDHDVSDWMTGEVGRFAVRLNTTLPTPTAGWVYTMLEAPPWVDVNDAGELDFAVPVAAPAATGTVRIRVRNGDSDRYRDLDLPYTVVAGNVLAQATYSALGGTLWTPDNSIGVQIADGTFSAPTNVQWVSYQSADGAQNRILRTQPRDQEFLLPPLLLTPGNHSRAVDGVDDCVDEWEAGWFAKLCTPGNFVSIRRVLGSVVMPVIATNRLPIGAQWTAPSQLTLQVVAPPSQTASTLAARCDQDCSDRVPVLFIHGYMVGGGLGGGSGTWGDLPEVLNGTLASGDSATGPIAAYEFRYRSNARFQDIAADLGAAIAQIYATTNNGNKVHLVAHSFGGLVARTYLQGLATNSQPIAAPVAGCVTSRHPFVASLLTLGSPHSGIAAAAGTLNGTLLPDGRHGSPGAGIGLCKQLSCWQAGEPEPFSSVGASAFKAAFGVEPEHGWLPAELSRFSSQPLRRMPVPTLSMIGLAEATIGSQFAGGDELISYQGQRFAPALSCTNGDCSDSTLGSTALTAIDGQSIGHCVYERVLGSVDPTQAPKPGTAGRPQTVHPQYVHSHVFSVAEPYFRSSVHLDGPDATYSKHDTLHRVRDWVLRQDPDPGFRRLRMTVSGPGAIIVDSGGSMVRCDGLPAAPPITCDFNVDANIRLRMEPVAALIASTPAICSGNTGSWCNWRVGAYEHVSAVFRTPNQATLDLSVTGPGQVQVTPGNHLCSGPCRYYYTLGTTVLINRAALPGGTWNQWSGACSGYGTQCTLALPDTGYPVAATASYSGIAIAPSKPLNDTGIDWCASATTNNQICPRAGFAEQDGDFGRDARARAGQLVKIGSGDAGFDYSKISNSGHSLPASAALGSGSNDWGCTRDNVSGLIWEVKLNDATSLRHMDHTYSWYNTDAAVNGGRSGTLSTAVTCNSTLSNCNTSAFVAAVNTQGMCGAGNWRMPTQEELLGIVHLGRFNPSIDPTYFPNTSIDIDAIDVWSGRSAASYPPGAWAVDFKYGSLEVNDKSYDSGIRLVHDGP